MTLTVIGIPWYSRKNWPVLRTIFVDASDLHDTFDEWRSSAGNLESRMRQQGFIVERIDIDPETFPQWCKSRRLKTDAQARSKFAGEVAREKHPDTD